MRPAMKMTFACVAALSFVASALVGGQTGGSAAKLTTPDIPGVVAGGTKIELLHTWDGKLGGEGPIAAPDGSLLFVHQDAAEVMKIDKDGKLSKYLENTNRATGLAFDPKGRLIGAGARPPQILVLAPTRSVLVEKFEGRAFMRPKHLVIDKRGGIYFTDLIPIENQDRGPKKDP